MKKKIDLKTAHELLLWVAYMQSLLIYKTLIGPQHHRYKIVIFIMR